MAIAPFVFTIADAGRGALGVAIAGTFAVRGQRKKSLSGGGAVAAFVVGALGLMCSYRFGFTLLAFYLSASRFTRFKAELKKKIEDGYKAGGQRGAAQVFGSTATGTLISLFYWLVFRSDGPVVGTDPTIRSALLLAYLAFFAAATGDTWASEVGLVAGLSKENPVDPVFILPPFRRVPRGTNGGVSLPGTLASIAGGLSIGALYFVLGIPFAAKFPRQWMLLVVGALGGAVGSLTDSILGAVAQANYLDPKTNKVLSVPPRTPEEARTRGLVHIGGRNLLTNEEVNLVSCTLTAAMAAMLPPWMF